MHEHAIIDDLNMLDRDALMTKMTSELPYISGSMGLTTTGICIRMGLDKERLSLIVSGKRKMKWSEYMSLLFFFWNDKKGREIIAEKGFFPEELKRAMAINRNEHE